MHISFLFILNKCIAARFSLIMDYGDLRERGGEREAEREREGETQGERGGDRDRERGGRDR